MTNGGDLAFRRDECMSALSIQWSRFILLMGWTADGISTLFPSSLHDFQYFKTPDYDIAETIGRFTFISWRQINVLFNLTLILTLLNPTALT
jgi:hypothetical protein